LAYITVTVTNNGREPMYESWIRGHLNGDPCGDPDPEPVGTILPGKPPRPGTSRLMPIFDCLARS
jgi:hypothetical protein